MYNKGEMDDSRTRKNGLGFGDGGEKKWEVIEKIVHPSLLTQAHPFPPSLPRPENQKPPLSIIGISQLPSPPPPSSSENVLFPLLLWQKVKGAVFGC